MNVPTLRFPEFSGAWKEKRLGDLVDPKRKITYGIVQPGEFVAEGVLLVRGGDYSDGWISTSEIKRVTVEIDKPYRRSKLKSGDLLLTIVGANTGNVAVVPSHLEDANITQTTARIAIDRQMASSTYVEQILKSRAGKKEVYSYIKGAAQPGLNLTDVVKFRFLAPTLPEQRKIAEFLGAVDARVALLGRRREALRGYKKGMMQRLFSQRLRFTKPDGSPTMRAILMSRLAAAPDI
ncbi:MAG: restriction endonuclease subunit S, partial [Novosphingobium sp.]